MYSQTTLLGYVGSEPRVTTLDNGRKLASFSLATTRRWRKDNEKQEETTWHRINVVSDAVAKITESYVKKGNLLMLTGRIQKRTYEKDGEEKESYEICIDFDGSVTLMPRTTAKEGGGARDNPAQSSGPAPAADFDDDIPF